MITVRFPVPTYREIMFGDMNYIRAAWKQGAYVDAAKIEGDNVHQAYAMMQNNGPFTPSWTLEPPPGLTPLMPPIKERGREYGNRSAMVGDVFVVNGKPMVCAMVGFEPLE